MSEDWDMRVDMGKRPDKDNMRGFEWIYWELMDKGENRLANAVAWLIGGYHHALATANWQAERRHEVEQSVKLGGTPALVEAESTIAVLNPVGNDYDNVEAGDMKEKN